MKRFFIIGTIVAVAAVLLVSEINAEPALIRFSHVVAENTPKGRAARLFAKLVNDRLKGKVEVRIFPNSELYDDEEAISELIAGNLEMAAPSTAKFTKWVPELQLIDLPFLFKDRMVFYAAMDGAVGKNIYGLFKPRGLLGLAMWDNGFKQLSNNRKDIRIPSDAEGMSFRIMPSKVLRAQFEKIGAEVKVFPFSKVYSVLKEGVVDGQENTWSNMYSKNLHQEQEFITASDHGYLGYVVVANAAFWERLPDEARTELEKILKEVTLWARQHAYKLNLEAKQKIVDSGESRIIQLTRKEKEIWRKTYKPLYMEFKDTVGADNLFEVFRLNSRHRF